MKEKLILRMVIVLNILLVILLFLFSMYIFREKETSKSTLTQVAGAQSISFEEDMKEETFSVSVCDSTSCVWISSDGLIKEGVVDENAVYQIVLDTVIPHFEKKYGGKTFTRNRSGSFIYWKEDVIPDLSNIFEDVYLAFKSRINTSVEVLSKDLPGTDGKYAQKYIEIDNSKQKLYVWIDGMVVKEIHLSAAQPGYQVYGVFPIIDKGVAPIAPGGRYMPYWMAFYYSPKQDSWYGLHALIWWYDENGKKIYEPSTNIGVRRSKGCIRMLLGDAKYLYEIFEKGDHILIHE